MDEILGNPNAINKLRRFASDANKGLKGAPVLVYGPSGIGKSAAVHMLAKENGWNVVELNASDYRDKGTIDTRMLSAATSRSLFGKRNLILLDEIDELAAGFDKGSASAINTLINESRNPIIFIANNMWDQSISFLRGKVEAVEFKRLQADTVHNVLTALARRFSLKVNKSAIEMMASRANGDARSAINDLSVLIGTDDEEVTEVIGLRDRKIDIFNLLDKIFLTSSLSAALRQIGNSDLPNDMLIKWIDENIPKRYRYGSEMYAAFESLAYASMFGSRAQRSQHYTYWRYMNVLFSGGVSLAKEHYPDIRTAYSFPKVIKELSTTKTARNQDRIIAAKLQRAFHSSIRKIIRNEMGLLSKAIAKSIKEDAASEDSIRDELMSRFGLEGKEVDYLLSRNN